MMEAALRSISHMGESRKIYLIRHGEPDFPGGEPLCLGRTDLPLSQAGRLQAALLGAFFADKALQVYCSPLLRARQTALAISPDCVPVAALREQDMGAWEGLSFREIRAQYPGLHRRRGMDPFGVQIPDGEPMEAFARRICSAFRRILRETTGDVAIVSHAGVNRLLLWELLGLPPEHLFTLKQDYGAMSVLQQDSRGIHVLEALSEPRPGLSEALRERLEAILGSREAFLRWEREYSSSAPKNEREVSALWQWKPDMIRFMNDASRYGSYDRALAENLLPFLSPGDRLCDMGCGLAYLSMALAPHVAGITAVDRNPDVLAAVRQNCAALGIRNLETLCADGNTLPESLSFDHMVFCFYGELEEILAIGKRHCRGQLFLIRRNYTTHRFSLGQHPLSQDSYDAACRQLDAMGLPYRGTTLSLEHGQPLRSLADARRFFELYSKDENPSRLTELFLEERLIRTGDAEFPYYLPQKRDVGILRLDVSSLP